MSLLLITLPDNLPSLSTPCLVALSEDGRTVHRHSETALSVLSTLPLAEVVAVVPAHRLSWQRVSLPKGTLKNKTRLRTVLEGLLEDRVLQDCADLHFAIQPQPDESAPVWIAVCDKKWLHAWLAALEQAGRPVLRIVPEFAPAAADDAPALAFIGEADAPRCVFSSAAGVVALPVGAAVFNSLALGEMAGVRVTSEPAVSALAESYFSGSIPLQTPAQRAVLAGQSAWDLAQFDLLRSQKARLQKRFSNIFQHLLHAKEWRPARWSLVALVAVHIVGLQAWAWQMQAAIKTKKAQINAVLLTTFPQTPLIVDAPAQMAKALSLLQQESGASTRNDMETLLKQYQAKNANNGANNATMPADTAPIAIEFVAGELKIKTQKGDTVVLKPE